VPPAELARVQLADWFLRPAERGNPATRLDARRGDGLAWSTGNQVRPLIHGASYFAELVARVPGMVAARRRLIYLEDQYLWSSTVVSALASALRDVPYLHLIAVIPRFPDQDGKLSLPPNLIGRIAALNLLRKAAGNRVAVYGIESEAGIPIYVHAKVCIVDDTWAIVGSDNFNRRSWTHDSELSCAVVDEAVGSRAAAAPDQRTAGYAATLRRTLASEHLGIRQADPQPGCDTAFEAFRQAAAEPDAWHAGGRKGPRPPGRLRRYDVPRLPTWTRAWARVFYRLMYDPDGRPPALRRSGQF